MTKGFVVGGFVAVLGLTLSACSVEAPDSTEDVDTNDEALGQPECLPTSPACRPCPPHHMCSLIACVCDAPGNDNSCDFIAACIQGYTWDMHSCSCVPAK